MSLVERPLVADRLLAVPRLLRQRLERRLGAVQPLLVEKSLLGAAREQRPRLLLQLGIRRRLQRVRVLAPLDALLGHRRVRRHRGLDLGVDRRGLGRRGCVALLLGAPVLDHLLHALHVVAVLGLQVVELLLVLLPQRVDDDEVVVVAVVVIVVFLAPGAGGGRLDGERRRSGLRRRGLRRNRRCC